MFCPVCRDEFRSGFTRCANCDVALVERLDSPRPRTDAPLQVPAAKPGEPKVNYCGFLEIDEALMARRALVKHGIAAEILVRDGEGPDGVEEYWLRVAASHFAAAQAVLGYDEADGVHADVEVEKVACSACGGEVDEDASRCPHCGERFED
ncbi:MAG TPA: hypothetical protein VF139_00455 [Candidatus Polarisedimenticolaceae bacterium]